MIRSVTLAALVIALAVPVVHAQPSESSPNPFRPIRIAKWGSLVAAAGTALYGFVKNGQADDQFEELERMCQAEPVRCEARTAAGEYLDPEFERRFAEVRALDRRAHTALLISQIGVGASVVLFLLDLGNARSPSDIPYDPTTFEVTPRRDGSVAISLSLPFQPLPR